jgi:hypothetical protein
MIQQARGAGAVAMSAMLLTLGCAVPVSEAPVDEPERPAPAASDLPSVSPAASAPPASELQSASPSAAPTGGQTFDHEWFSLSFDEPWARLRSRERGTVVLSLTADEAVALADVEVTFEQLGETEPFHRRTDAVVRAAGSHFIDGRPSPLAGAEGYGVSWIRPDQSRTTYYFQQLAQRGDRLFTITFKASNDSNLTRIRKHYERLISSFAWKPIPSPSPSPSPSPGR